MVSDAPISPQVSCTDLAVWLLPLSKVNAEERTWRSCMPVLFNRSADVADASKTATGPDVLRSLALSAACQPACDRTLTADRAGVVVVMPRNPRSPRLQVRSTRPRAATFTSSSVSPP